MASTRVVAASLALCFAIAPRISRAADDDADPDTPHPWFAVHGGASLWPDTYGPMLGLDLFPTRRFGLAVRGAAGDSATHSGASALDAYASFDGLFTAATLLDAAQLRLDLRFRAGAAVGRLLPPATSWGAEAGASLDLLAWQRIGVSFGTSVLSVPSLEPDGRWLFVPSFQLLATLAIGPQAPSVPPVEDGFIGAEMTFFENSLGSGLKAGFDRQPFGIEVSGGIAPSNQFAFDAPDAWIFGGLRKVVAEDPTPAGRLRVVAHLGGGAFEMVNWALGTKVAVGAELLGRYAAVSVEAAAIVGYMQDRGAIPGGAVMLPIISIGAGYRFGRE